PIVPPPARPRPAHSWLRCTHGLAANPNPVPVLCLLRMVTTPDRWRQWSRQLARGQEERPPLYAPARRTIVMTTQAPSSHLAPARTGADPLRGNPVLTDLVTRAAQGDKHAWDALVERFAPLIWSICRKHRLGDADAEDVGQNVWLQLMNQLGKIRDPA